MIKHVEYMVYFDEIDFHQDLEWVSGQYDNCDIFVYNKRETDDENNGN